MKRSEKIVLGTVQLGLPYGISNITGKPTQQEAFEILNYAYDSGLRTLDCANAYGDALELIAKYHHETKKKFRIVNKFHLHTPDALASIKEQLKALSIPGFQSLLFHSYEDFLQSGTQVMDRLRSLKEDALIGEIGVSVYTNDQFQKAIESHQIDTIQIPFNVLDNAYQRMRLIDEAKGAGKRIQVRSIFLQGLFFSSPESLPARLSPLKKYLEQFLRIVNSCGRTVEDVCLSYAMNFSNIDHVLMGIDTKKQLQKNLSYLEQSLPVDIVDQINEIKVEEITLLYPSNWK